MKYTENPSRTLLHDVRVWISGVEVTDRLLGSVQVDTVGRGGHNTCSFTLSNASDGFILTEENANGTWRLGGAKGEHGEQIKFALHQFKDNDLLNPVNDDTGERRWPLEEGAPVLHALDPVFIAARWPYADTRFWIPVFKGYIESKPFNDDWIKGQSTLTVSCHDIRGLMAYMRVQMNYLIANESTAVSSSGTGRASQESKLNAFDPVLMAGLLQDLQLPTNLSTPLANLSFEDTIRLLIIGGILQKPEVDATANNPDKDSDAANAAFLQDLSAALGGSTRGISFNAGDRGVTEARVLAGVEGETGTSFDVKGIGRFQQALGVVRWPSSTGYTADDVAVLETWHRMCLFGFENAGEPWTDRQVEFHGAECTWEGTTAPHAGQLLMLMPSTAGGLKNLTEYTVDSTATTRSWSSRRQIIEDLLEKLDYQWFVTGSGDIVIEFPMYDFLPTQFGEWDEALTVRHDGEGKTTATEDDKPQIPSVLQATGSYDPRAREGGSDLFIDALLRGDGMSLTNTRVTLYAPMIAARIGMRVERVSFPYVTDVCRLRQFAVLAYQRKIAEANTLSCSFIYRPIMLPNRPILETGRDRMAWIASVSNTFSRRAAHGMPASSATLKYVRRRNTDGEYTLLTGSRHMPLSYSGVGPLMGPQRGIQMTESYQPPGDNGNLINAPCSENAVQGAPDNNVIQQITPGSMEEAIGKVPVTCLTGDYILADELRALWISLQNAAKNQLGLTLELICTFNSGTKHENITPYGHADNPATAFDIAITKPDGTSGGDDDYAAVGVLGESLGLVWGGSGPETPAVSTPDLQRAMVARANYHITNKTPYVWGGNGPDQVDCSGMIVDIFRHVGLFGPTDDAGAGTFRQMFPEPQNRAPVPGELAFYCHPRRLENNAEHVAMVIEDSPDGTNFPLANASGPGSASTSAKKAREKGWGVVRKSTHLYRGDFIGFGAVFDVVGTSVKYRNHFQLA